MQIHVTGHQIEVTPALRKYTIDKLERTGRHFDGVYDTQVVLTVEKTHHRAEATVSAARHKVLHAEATGVDMYAAIDSLADKLEAQARKHKEKLTDHHRADALRSRKTV